MRRGKAPAESKKSPEQEFVRAILVQFCSSVGGVLLFKLRAQHAVFSLQGVELVVQRGELLFELARDDALIEFVPARCAGCGAHDSHAAGDEAGLFPVDLADDLQHGALVELFAAQRRGRSALRAHGENVDGFEHFHRIVLLDPCLFFDSKGIMPHAECQPRRCVAMDRKTCYDDRRFLIRKEARGAMLPR